MLAGTDRIELAPTPDVLSKGTPRVVKRELITLPLPYRVLFPHLASHPLPLKQGKSPLIQFFVV